MGEIRAAADEIRLRLGEPVEEFLRGDTRCLGDAAFARSALEGLDRMRDLGAMSPARSALNRAARSSGSAASRAFHAA